MSLSGSLLLPLMEVFLLQNIGKLWLRKTRIIVNVLVWVMSDQRVKCDIKLVHDI